MLRGFGLDLPGSRQVGHQGEVNEQRHALPELDAHLANGFQKRQRLNVADGAADLHQRHLGIAGRLVDGGLDLVGDVGNHLHGTAQILATTLLTDDALVDLAGGEIVDFTHAHASETLVVTEIQIRFRAVVGDVDLTVLERIHGARIHIDVRIELYQGYADATGFENGSERSGGNTLAQ